MIKIQCREYTREKGEKYRNICVREAENEKHVLRGRENKREKKRK